MSTYILAASLACLFSFLLSLIAEKVAFKFNIVDVPGGRKIHNRTTPLLGGTAIFISFFLIIFLFSDKLVVGNLNISHWLWFFAGAVFLMIGGVWDDAKNLRPGQQVAFPIIAVACVIAGGIGIEKISNPFGGLLFFSNFLSDSFTVAWLMAMMYSTKLLDGVDGLVAGVSLIGGLIIFLFTTTTRYYQPDIAFASLVLAASCLGFLFRNWNPAKIFLGESGSLFLGYCLGVLSIISGGKIAIALLVLGLPLLDLAWTIVRRLIKGQNPFKTSDKKHLHHRFLEMGFSQKKTVILFYSFSVFFGLGALFLQSRGKIVAIILLLLLMGFLIAGFSFLEKKKSKSQA